MLNRPRLTSPGTGTALTWQAARVGRGVIILGLVWCAAPGAVPAAARGRAQPRCFGAAARDRRHPCRNPRLRLSVTPTPADAVILPNAPCTPIERADLLNVCAFGYDGPAPRGVVALVGDSHAGHWRAAVEVVAQARRWRGISLTRSGCPFSTAVARLPGVREEQCTRWNAEVRDWIGRHPEIATVIVSEHVGGDVVLRGRRTEFGTQVRGYVRGWTSLPHTVKRITVVRDVPVAAPGTMDCVAHAMARRVRAGPACAVPRASALPADPAAIAAQHVRSRRIRLIDMTPYFCSRRMCFPVIGGALVHKDTGHLTAVYSTSLGPYLDRASRRKGRAHGEDAQSPLGRSSARSAGGDREGGSR